MQERRVYEYFFDDLTNSWQECTATTNKSTQVIKRVVYGKYNCKEKAESSIFFIGHSMSIDNTITDVL